MLLAVDFEIDRQQKTHQSTYSRELTELYLPNCTYRTVLTELYLLNSAY